MSCRRTSAMNLFVLVLLIASLLALHLPTVRARHVAVANPDNGLNSGATKNLAKPSTDDLAAKKEFSWRRHGASSKEGAGAIGATTTTISAGSRPRTVEMRAAAKHGDAIAEMYNMLRRDYAWRARRRRPINNGATPLQVNEKP
ncbi:hypothetical protein BS78_06G126800 [Paspalum vaginatum]|nr:hypothetical protein BS78_06G126800 [Paspalum vaginatum]